jgi:hypothetical protein
VFTESEMEQALTGTLPSSGIRDDIKRGGIDAHVDKIVAGLLVEARDHAQRIALERRERSRLDELDVPILDLPYLNGGIDLGSLYELAAILREQGAR